jgi:hypothetical protein
MTSALRSKARSARSHPPRKLVAPSHVKARSTPSVSMHGAPARSPVARAHDHEECSAAHLTLPGTSNLFRRRTVLRYRTGHLALRHALPRGASCISMATQHGGLARAPVDQVYSFARCSARAVLQEDRRCQWAFAHPSPIRCRHRSKLVSGSSVRRSGTESESGPHAQSHAARDYSRVPCIAPPAMAWRDRWH